MAAPVIPPPPTELGCPVCGELTTWQVGDERTPSIDEGYWSYRVRLTDRQAVVGFPKFLTIGIGFAVEEDRNTNLPYTVDADEIYEHIEHNRGDDAIRREDVLTGIRLIQDRAATDRAAGAW